MALKLYLHIGHPKCGSSTIQEALHLNRMALRDLGYGVCGEDLKLMGRRAKHRFPLGYFLNAARTVWAGGAVDLRADFEALYRSAKRARLKAVVVSAENLSAVWAPAAIAVAKDYFDCEIIHYFRRQDDWLLSAWSQWHFKAGESLPAFIARRMRSGRSGIYRDVLEEYLAHFPLPAMKVRLLSRKHLVGGDLVSDFWQATGLEGAALAPVRSQNVSFSAQLANTFKESAYLFEHGHDNRLTAYVDSHHRYARGVKKDALTVAERRAILDRYADENEWLEKKFFAPGTLGDWCAIADVEDEAGRAERRRRDEPTLRGIAEMVSLNIAVLQQMREDVDRLKASLGLD